MRDSLSLSTGTRFPGRRRSLSVDIPENARIALLVNRAHKGKLVNNIVLATVVLDNVNYPIVRHVEDGVHDNGVTSGTDKDQPARVETRQSHKRLENQLCQERDDTRLQLQRAEECLQRERDEAQRQLHEYECRLERLQSHVTEPGQLSQRLLGGDEGEDIDQGETEQQPVRRRPTQRGSPKGNIAQQSSTLVVFKGNDVDDSSTNIFDWFDEFNALAEVYEWTDQEKLVALVSKLKDTALSCYHTAPNEDKRSFEALRRELVEQFQPVRVQAVQNNLFKRRVQKSGESVGDYYRP